MKRPDRAAKLYNGSSFGFRCNFCSLHFGPKEPYVFISLPVATRQSVDVHFKVCEGCARWLSSDIWRALKTLEPA